MQADCVTACPQSAASFDESGFSISHRRCVESFWARHLFEEHMRLVRAATPIAGSRQMARLLSGSSGMLGSWLPGFHIFHDCHQVEVFLESLQDICWCAGVQRGCESDHGRDFERVLWRWASTRSEWSQNDRGECDQDDREAPIAAVSAKLRRVSLWRLAFGFLVLRESSCVSSIRLPKIDDVPGSRRTRKLERVRGVGCDRWPRG